MKGLLERGKGLKMVREMEGVGMELGVGRVKEKDGRRSVKEGRSTDGKGRWEGIECKVTRKERVWMAE